MGRWLKPEVYPLMAAMTFVTGMCIFQLTRNILTNPDVRKWGSAVHKSDKMHYKVQCTISRVNKAHRTTAVLENEEEGKKYSQHGLRQFLRTRPPEVMPSINHFFSDTK